MSRLERILIVMEFNQSKGINKESVNEVYRAIVNKKLLMDQFIRNTSKTND